MTGSEGSARPTLQDFRGVWHLSRQIEDRRAGQDGHATGRAVLSPDAGGLVYDELVTLHLPGQAPIEGRRRYLWRAVPGGIAVLFEDGRPFHVIARGADAAKALHHCDPDVYAVRYDFAPWPRWSSRWEVSGPRKNYAMTTRYARGDAG